VVQNIHGFGRGSDGFGFDFFGEPVITANSASDVLLSTPKPASEMSLRYRAVTESEK